MVKCVSISVYVSDSSMSDLIVVGDLTSKWWHLLLLSGHLHLHLLLLLWIHHAWMHTLRRHSLWYHTLRRHAHRSLRVTALWEATLRHDCVTEDIYVGWVLNVVKQGVNLILADAL